MLSAADFLNRVVKERLSAPRQHSVDLQYGFDANKVKGVKDFPIYNRTGGFVSKAATNADSVLFKPSSKFDVRAAVHTRAPTNLQPVGVGGGPVSPSPHTNARVDPRVLSKLYGIPPDRTIVLENFAAKATGLSQSKTPELDIMLNNWQQSAKTENIAIAAGIVSGSDDMEAFMNLPKTREIIEGRGRARETSPPPKSRARATISPERAPRQAVVNPAFDIPPRKVEKTASPPRTPTGSEGGGAFREVASDDEADLARRAAKSEAQEAEYKVWLAAREGKGKGEPKKAGGDDDDEGEDDEEEVEKGKIAGGDINWDLLVSDCKKLGDTATKLKDEKVSILDNFELTARERALEDLRRDLVKLSKRAKIPSTEAKSLGKRAADNLFTAQENLLRKIREAKKAADKAK